MLFALMIVVVADVSLRYLFNSPLAWSYDAISLFLLPGVFFLSVGYTQGSHGHVSVDILHNYVSERTRYVFEALTSAIAAPVFGFIAWIAAQKTWIDWVTGTYLTSGLEVPTWSTSFLLPLGFGLLAVRSLLNVWGYLATLITHEPWLALPPISGTEAVQT
jgi:TRAP-type C4-dicarboxylate transport system permease small subunit